MRWLPLALVLVGCGGSGSSAHSPSAQTVLVASAPLAPPEPPGALPTAFRCLPSRPIERARIVATFTSELSVMNHGGEPLAPQKVLDVEVVYTIARLTAQAPERAELVLERHTEGVPSGKHRKRDGWVHALEGGWIRQGAPFVIERRVRTWCFVDKPCPPPLSEPHTFLGLLGTTIALLAPLPEVVARLDRRGHSRGLSFEVPELLATRLGLGPGEKATATQVGLGLPATFEVTFSDGEPPSWAPDLDHRTLTARIQIDEACRVRDVSLVHETLARLGPQMAGASRSVDRHRWRTDPID